MSFSDSKKPVFVVSGASGSGKTTICRIMSNEFGLYYSVSHTTRPKRHREVNERDYYFVEKSEFESMIEADEFYEWAKVYDNYYGTSKSVIDQQHANGRGVILDLDTQGAALIKDAFPDAVLVFLKTPDLKDLQDRLTKRGRDSNDEIKKRVAYAENEISKINQYDYVIMNDDLDDAVKVAREIVQKHLTASQE